MHNLLNKVFKSPARVMLVYNKKHVFFDKKKDTLNYNNSQILHIIKKNMLEEDFGSTRPYIEIRAFSANNKNNIKKFRIDVSRYGYPTNREEEQKLKKEQEFALYQFTNPIFETGPNHYKEIQYWINNTEIERLKSILSEYNLYGNEVREIGVFDVQDFVRVIVSKTKRLVSVFEQDFKIFGLHFFITKKNNSPRSWGGDHSVSYKWSYNVSKIVKSVIYQESDEFSADKYISKEKDKVFDFSSENYRDVEDLYRDVFKYFYNGKKYIAFSYEYDHDPNWINFFIKKKILPADIYTPPLIPSGDLPF